MKQRFLYAAVRLVNLQGCSGRFIFQSLRAVSDSSAGASGALKQWSIAVSPFIRVKCRLHCDIVIQPLDPHAFPGADRALISLHGLNGHGADQDFKLDSFQVHYDQQSNELTINSDETSSNLSVELTTPIKSDLEVVTRGTGSVSIRKMESDLCQVQTEKGHCVLQSLKSHKLQVQSSGGNITGNGTIHGDIEISTAGDSSVNIKKIQGNTMNVSTHQGPLNVKAIYAEYSSVASSSGKVHIGHLHGEAHVQNDTGDILIDSSSSDLTAVTNAGNIDVYVSQTGTAILHAQQGAVNIRVPETIKAGVQLGGTTVHINSEISQETERHSADGKTVIMAQLNSGSREDCWIKATANRGPVSLKTQSWFETLKLRS
uniref:Family with sequence similarity 185 member A n=1 Tax=Astyanax mexicanus TaxID=7994 RepID=W5K3G5_ASTMX